MNLAAIVLALAAPAFAGVCLGDTPASVIAERGDPSSMHDDGGGKMQFEYLAPSGGAIQLVIFDQGLVSAVALVEPMTSAPLPGLSAAGITLGETIPSEVDPHVKQFTRPAGDGAVYEFGLDPTRGIVSSIVLTRAPNAPTPLPVASASGLPPVHGGSSVADAVVIRADTDGAGTRSEYFYLALHQCGTGGHWRLDTQSLLTNNGKTYDRLDVECTAGGKKRSFYFDITNSFGRH